MEQSGFFVSQKAILSDGTILIETKSVSAPRKWTRKEYYRISELSFFNYFLNL